MKSIQLEIQNMNCGSCVKHIEAAINKINGINDVVVDLSKKRVTMSFAESVSEAQLFVRLNDAGYPATLVRLSSNEEDNQ